MATEVERKFLVDGESWRAASNGARSFEIRQGYLTARKTLSIRVRVVEDRATLTIKGATRGYSRNEYEYDVPVQDARELLELCRGEIIEKRRYVVDVDGREWEIDEFSGANDGLIVAEVELNTEDEQVDLPEWLGEEISDRPEYFNSNLSKRPYSEWTPGKNTDG